MASTAGLFAAGCGGQVPQAAAGNVDCPAGTTAHTVRARCVRYDSGGTRIEGGEEIEDEQHERCPRWQLFVCGRELDASRGATAEVCRDGRGLNHGLVRVRDAAGRRREEGRCAGDLTDGVWTTWYAGGERESQTSYRRGVRHGSYRTWHRNGQLRLEGHMVDGRPHGTIVIRDERGNVVRSSTHGGR